MAFEFRCSSCSEMHRGMPNFGADAPLSYYEIPAEQRDARCRLGSDDCVIDETWCFVRGCIELPVGPFFGWLNAWLKPYPRDDEPKDSRAPAGPRRSAVDRAGTDRASASYRATSGYLGRTSIRDLCSDGARKGCLMRSP